jgi:hypothetical protein
VSTKAVLGEKLDVKGCTPALVLAAAIERLAGAADRARRIGCEQRLPVGIVADMSLLPAAA